MIVIRQPQVKSMHTPLGEYERHALEVIASQYPAELEARGQDGCRELIDRACTKAQGYGMSESPQVTGILSLMIVFGEDFDMASAERRAVLESPLDGADKLDALLEVLTREQGA